MFGYSEDKNKLAMMAIPVILSLFFGLSNGISGNYTSGTTTGLPSSVNLELSEDSEMNNNRNQKRYALQKAIEAADFVGFKEVTRDTPFADIITAEAFSLLVEEYHLQKDGYRPASLYFGNDLTA